MPIEPQSLLTLPLQSDGEYRQWYFAFTENQTELPWWQNLAVRNDPEHLRHCYAFTQVGQFVLFVEPHRDRIDMVIKYPTDEYPVMCAEYMAQELTDAGHVVVRNTYIPNIRGWGSIWNFIPSCVTVVKCATGYSSHARTPKKLLHCLIKNGAEVFYKGDIL